MKLLIAEDEPISRRIIESMVRKWGYDVTVAGDGNKAWEIMQSNGAPGLALLDWMMPGMDGVDVCRRVRELKTPLRPYIILLTGKEGKGDLVAGISAGADDYVTKPFVQEELQVRIRAGERILEMQMEMLAAKEALRFQATHDALTGLLNRASGLARLQRELSVTERTGRLVGVAMIDLDHFKKVNDTYGHAAGDSVLVEAAKRMTAHMRPYEDLARFGGEEFLVVLTECDLTAAECVAERLRSCIADREIDVPGAKLAVTASIGVACSSQLEHPTDKLLISLADAALYRAKEQGRNRVVRAEVHATV